MMDLAPILSETLDAATKGYPLSSLALPISAIGAQRWSLLAGDLPLPLAVIRDSALAHNHAWMRDFTVSTGVLLAPHGKTTMARRSSRSSLPRAPGGSPSPTCSSSASACASACVASSWPINSSARPRSTR
jgi:D-serine dehydratase